MKTTFILIVMAFLTCFTAGWAQPFHTWSKQNVGGSSQRIVGSVVDNIGCTYNYGEFTGTVDFDPGPGTLNYTSPGSDDLFVQKLDGSGNLLWAIHLGGASSGIWDAFDIALDPTNSDILLTGRVLQSSGASVDFDPGAGVVNVTGSKTFLWRLGTNGGFGFVRTWHENVLFSAMHVASNGDIYLGGTYLSHATGYYDMDPNAGNFSFPSFGTFRDGFLMKLSNNSTFQWAKQLKSNNASGWPTINGICTNTLNQNVFVVGTYQGAVLFSPTEHPTLVTTSAGLGDIFMHTFVSTTGAAYTVQSLGSTEDDAATAVTTNGSTVYVGGYFRGTVNFDPGFSNTSLSSLGQADIFLLRFTNFPPQSVANLSWARRTGGTDNDLMVALSLDAAGNVYCGSNFNGSMDADPGTGTFTLTSAGQQDLAIQKMSQSGNLIWAVSIGGATSDGISAIHATNNDVYYSGFFTGNVDLDPTSGVQNFSTSSGSDFDLFSTRLSQCGDTPVISSNSPVCELTSTNLQAPTIPGASYSWSGPGGFTSTQEDATRPNAVGSHAGIYYLTVSVGTCVYPVALTQVQIASQFPNFTISPANVSMCASSPGPINFTSTGSTNSFPISYQWQKDGVNISGATSSTYSIPSPTVGDAGIYRVVVTAACATVNSNNATVIIDPSAPVITTQPSPSDLSICQGGTLNLSSGATNGTISYQWRRNGTNISGATSPTYADAYVDLSEGGTYQLVATNACGSATSQSVSVSVPFLAPSITTQPINQVICEGGTVTFSAAGNNVFNYQWRKNGVNIPGATSATYTINPANLLDAGAYSVVLTNGCGSVTSAVATLTVNANTPVTITSQPQSVTACTGTSVTFSVVASGSIGSYQWRKDGTNIPGANSASYTIPGVLLSQAGSYDVVITGACSGSVTSTAAVLTVLNSSFVGNGLVFHLPFDGNITEAINNTGSSGSYNYVGATDRFGNSNGAATFTGTTNRIYNIYPGQPALNNSYTISTWINVASGQWNDANGICGWGNYGMSIENNRLRLTNQGYMNYWFGNDFNVAVPVGQNQTGVWKHIVVTYDGTTQRFFENGVQIGVRTTPAPNVALTSTSIGSSVSTWEYFKGLMDDFRIYNRAITPAEVSALYGFVPLTAATLPATQSGCVGYNFTQSVTVTGAEGLTYQWMFNGTPLVDGGSVSGAQTATLSISNLSAVHAGNYSVQVTQNGCVQQLSNTMALSLGGTLAINTQPTSQTICENQALNLSVSATGSNLSYQWTLNGTNIAGATSATYSVASASAAQAGSYQVVVSNACGSISSNAVNVSLNAAPAISTQPQSVTICAGQPLTLSVNAIGNNLTYQWRRNGVNIAGATASTYTVASSTSANAGTYTVVITNSCGNVTSTSVTVTVNTSTNITAQPVSPGLICAGSPFTLSATAVGTNLTYQWLLAGTPIPGATSTSYTVSSATTSQAGSYLLQVNGTCGSTLTNGVMVDIFNAPSIVSQPQSQTACLGQSVTLNVNATGNNLSYQWRLNGSPLSGSTNASLTMPSIALSQAGNYDVVITNSCGSVTSSVATINVNTAPTIISQPQSATVCQGASVLFGVNFSGVPSAFQWRRNGVAIPGATSTTLTIPAAQVSDEGNYTLDYTTTCGVLTSQAAVLDVQVFPTITQHPQGISICAGQALNVAVQTQGDVSSYQWMLNGSPIVGATAANYTVPSATPAQAGTYSVNVINNVCGNSALSQDAVIQIATAPIFAQQPVGGTFCQGDTVSFVSQFSNAVDIYEWWYLGSPLAGGSGPVLTLNNVQTSQSGTYVLNAYNQCGNTFSSLANIQVNPSYQQTITQTICFGDSYVFNGTNLSQAGTYVEHLQTISGCDSITTLVLSVLPENQTQLSASICLGDSYQFDGQSLTASGTYSALYTAATGCDSLVELSLVVVDPNQVYPTAVSLCPGNSLIWGSQTLTQAGVYQQVFTAVGGCDSLVELTLTLVTVPVVSIANNSGNLSVTSGLSNYQWYLNGVAISGATSASHTAIQDGNYHVVFETVEGCTGSSDTLQVDVDQVGIEEKEDLLIQVFPNPTSDEITILLPAGVDENTSILVLDLSGRIVKLHVLYSPQTEIKLLLDDLPTGCFWLKVDGYPIQQIIKQ